MTDQNSKRRILAVDDVPDITLTVKMGLEASGTFEVQTFNDHEVALSFFNPGPSHLALLDMRMPKMYGHELFDKLKKIDGSNTSGSTLGLADFIFRTLSYTCVRLQGQGKKK